VDPPDEPSADTEYTILAEVEDVCGTVVTDEVTVTIERW